MTSDRYHLTIIVTVASPHTRIMKYKVAGIRDRLTGLGILYHGERCHSLRLESERLYPYTVLVMEIASLIEAHFITYRVEAVVSPEGSEERLAMQVATNLSCRYQHEVITANAFWDEDGYDFSFMQRDLIADKRVLIVQDVLVPEKTASIASAVAGYGGRVIGVGSLLQYGYPLITLPTYAVICDSECPH